MAYIKKTGTYPRKNFSARPSFGPRRDTRDEPVQRFQATCSECKKMCEVPFRPNGKKPVYCRDCFKGKEEIPSHGAHNSFVDRVPRNPDFAKRLDAIDAKLDRILKSIG